MIVWVIPSPARLQVVVVALAVEHGGSPPGGDGLGPATKPLHVADGGGRLGVPYESSDVLQRLVAVHEQRGDDRGQAGVRA